MLQAAGRDPETPWLLWTKACEGLMATWPTLPSEVEGGQGPKGVVTAAK